MSGSFLSVIATARPSLKPEKKANLCQTGKYQDIIILILANNFILVIQSQDRGVILQAIFDEQILHCPCEQFGPCASHIFLLKVAYQSDAGLSWKELVEHVLPHPLQVVRSRQFQPKINEI